MKESDLKLIKSVWPNYPKTTKIVEGKQIFCQEYFRWRTMKHRCYFKNNSMYYLYGGRGIKVCDEWKNNFWSFLVWCLLTKIEGCTIDRINTDGDYSPDNCRWATPSEQQSNVRITDRKRNACKAAQEARKNSGYSDLKYRIRDKEGKLRGSTKRKGLL